MKFTLLTFDSLDSTNTEALRQAKSGAAEGLCIVAREQTAGRGRHGRHWSSDKDAGLYFSIVLRPELETEYLPLLTLMAGVAVNDTLRGFGLEPDIKWVNDVLVGERKIAGILAETTDTAAGLAVIVGIGINLRASRLPTELGGTATSIEAETGTVVDAASVISSLTANLDRFYSLLNRPVGAARVLEEWRSRSSYSDGKGVRVKTGAETVIGVTEGLEPNGALRVRREDGTTATIQAGDVERLRVNED